MKNILTYHSMCFVVLQLSSFVQNSFYRVAKSSPGGIKPGTGETNPKKSSLIKNELMMDLPGFGGAVKMSSTSCLSTRDVTWLGGVRRAWLRRSAMYTHQCSCLSSVKKGAWTECDTRDLPSRAFSRLHKSKVKV